METADNSDNLKILNLEFKIMAKYIPVIGMEIHPVKSLRSHGASVEVK
jgi:hypothetical protein